MSTPDMIWKVGTLLLGIGVFGLLARGELISRLIAIEVAFNGVVLAASAAMVSRGATGGGSLLLFAFAVTVSEVGLALALWVRHTDDGGEEDPGVPLQGEQP